MPAKSRFHFSNDNPMNDKTAYPLSWPDGWPRTEKHRRQESRFQRPVKFAARRHSMDEVRRELANEIDRLGARKAILSTNVRLRLDGLPYSNQAQPDDTGAAVYFELKQKPVSLACDKWRRVEDNIWAIVKHVESIRGQDRWGVGNIEQAFRGYMALPERASGSAWWETLGVTINASEEQVKDAYRLLVKKHHPDTGGDVELFRRVQEAFNQSQQIHRKDSPT